MVLMLFVINDSAALSVVAVLVHHRCCRCSWYCFVIFC